MNTPAIAAPAAPAEIRPVRAAEFCHLQHERLAAPVTGEPIPEICPVDRTRIPLHPNEEGEAFGCYRCKAALRTV